jgi:hypothetical protein
MGIGKMLQATDANGPDDVGKATASGLSSKPFDIEQSFFEDLVLGVQQSLLTLG